MMQEPFVDRDATHPLQHTHALIEKLKLHAEAALEIMDRTGDGYDGEGVCITDLEAVVHDMLGTAWAFLQHCSHGVDVWPPADAPVLGWVAPPALAAVVAQVQDEREEGATPSP